MKAKICKLHAYRFSALSHENSCTIVWFKRLVNIEQNRHNLCAKGAKKKPAISLNYTVCISDYMYFLKCAKNSWNKTFTSSRLQLPVSAQWLTAAHEYSGRQIFKWNDFLLQPHDHPNCWYVSSAHLFYKSLYCKAALKC